MTNVSVCKSLSMCAQVFFQTELLCWKPFFLPYKKNESHLSSWVFQMMTFLTKHKLSFLTFVVVWKKKPPTCLKLFLGVAWVYVYTSPWYDLRGWLGVKQQLSIYLLCLHWFSTLLFNSPVPEGMKSSPIPDDYISIVDSTWKFTEEGTESVIRQLLEHHFSVVLTSDDGQHVGHMMGQSYGSMGQLYVHPQFRRKGYAKVIISQLAQMYFDKGEDAYVVIEDDNLPSINLHLSVGFKAVPDFKMAWMIYTPKGCCKCMSRKCCV